MIQARCDMEVHAPAEIVFSIVWDVARYPDFMTDVVDTRVEAIEGESWAQHAEFDTNFVRARRYTVRMRAEPPTRVQWTMVSGEGISANDGTWDIAAFDDGRSCTLGYAVKMAFDAPVPDAIARRIIEFNLPMLLRQVKARAEARWRALDI